MDTFPGGRVFARGVSLAVAASLVVLASLTAGPAATADPGGSAGDVDWTQPGAWNGLTAPDAISARMLAALKHEAVEDLSQRSESSQTFALPDGQWRSDMSAGPEWVATGEDPSTEAGWKALDTDLVHWSDGSYRPGAHPANLVFSGGGSGPLMVVSGVNRDGGPFSLTWDGDLPTPIVEADAIRYENVEPDIDLVFYITATGYEQFFVAKTPEALEHTDELSLSFTSPDDPLKVKADTLVVNGDDGSNLADVSAVEVWDAAADADRMNPVADMATGGDDPADAPAADLNNAPVTTPITADLSVDGDTGTLAIDTADVPVESTTQFPVVIDPTINLTLSFDTYVSTVSSGDKSSETELLIGTPDSGTGVYRSYMNVNVSKVIGKKINSATLKMYEFHAWSCTAKSWEVWSTSTTSTSTRWSNKPALGTKYASTTATKGYSSSCPDGTVSQDITTLVQAWANSTTTTRGLALKAGSETDNFYWKRFYSGNSSSNKPVLSVTYNSYPNTPTSVKVNGVAPAAGATYYTNDTTPTFTATVSDADGGNVKGMFSLNGGTAVAGSSVASGSASSYTPSARANGSTTTVSVAASDGTLTSKSSIAPTWSVVVDTTPPGTVSVSSPQFDDGEWLENGPSSASATFSATGAVGFDYVIDGGAPQHKDATAESATIYTLPITAGRHTVVVTAVDRAGNTSAQKTFTYGIGSVAISAPGTLYKTTDTARVAGSASPATAGTVTRSVWVRPSGKENGAGYSNETGSTQGWDQVTSLGTSISTPVAAPGIPSVDTTFSAAAYAHSKDKDRVPFLIDVQVCFTYSSTTATACTWRDDEATHAKVLRIPHAFGDNFPVASAGPGQVAMWTGEFNTSTTDLEVPGYTGTLSLSRSYNTFAGGTEGSVFGPGWVPSFDGADVGSAGLTVIDTTSTNGLLVFQDVDGSYLLYREPGNGHVAQQPGTYVALDDDTAALGYVVKITGTDSTAVLSLIDDDGVTTTWKPVTAGNWVQTAVIEPGSAATTTFTDDGAGHIIGILAPTPAGVTCTTLVAGCRKLEISYYTSEDTAPGAFTGHVKQVKYWAWNPAANGGTGGMDSQNVVAYAYDADGRLTTVTDERNHLKTEYAYSGASDAGVPLLTSVKPGGLAAWHMTYGTSSQGTGSLLSVSRDAPVQDGDQVPMSRYIYGIQASTPPSGTPAITDLVKVWSQNRVPSVGFAVFGPGEDPNTNTVSSISGSAWKNAQLTYTDDLGYTVNTAEFGAGDWQLTATEFDAGGRVAREWDQAATGALLDLSGPSHTNTVAPETVNSLASITRYNPTDIKSSAAVTLANGTVVPANTVLVPAGTLITDTWAPASDDAGTGLARVHTHFVYDEGAPTPGVNKYTGQKFSLVTTTVTTKAPATSGSWSPSADVPDDPVAAGEPLLAKSTSGYDPNDGIDKQGATSGWILGAPTVTTTVMPNSADNITTKVWYDTLGRVVQSRGPGSTGNDAGTGITIYYTVGANSDDAACGNHPEWAGLECVSKSGEPEASRTLPIERTAAYSFLLAPTVVTETLGSVERKSETTYLPDGRTDTTKLTVTGLSTSSPVDSTAVTYDPDTGLPLKTETKSGSTVTGWVANSLDLWGRNKGYTASNDDSSTNTYDAAGRLSTVNDGKHTVTYRYDGVTAEGEPGNDALGNEEHRGLITAMDISGVGEFTAAYDGAGNMVLQKMPGNISQESTYDLAGNATSLVYTGLDVDNQPTPLIGWTQDTDLFGRVVHETTPADAQGVDSMGEYSRTYTYDRAGRLVTVNDRSAAAGDTLDEDGSDSVMTPCVTRSYAFDTHGNRTSRTTAVSGSNGICPTTGGTSETWTYDAADRVQTGANATGNYVYDALGRQTTIPAIDTPTGAGAGDLQVAYYDNDLVRSLDQNGTKTTFTLDAMSRRYIATSVASGGTTTVVRHYADATDNPAWAVKKGPDGVEHTTWYGTSIGGDLGLNITDDAVSLEVADIHGDTATSINLDSSGSVDTINSYSDYDEYGRPLAATATASTGAVTYGWLGGKERATDGATGLLLMGVRLYNPNTGLFTSPDPVAGGNSTAYAYPQDPINKYDLDGKAWGWLKKVAAAAKVVAKVADIAAFIPGPIGMVCAGVATAAYLASGDYKSAASAALGMVPGGKLLGTVAKVAAIGVVAVGGYKAGKAAVAAVRTAKVAWKISGHATAKHAAAMGLKSRVGVAKRVYTVLRKPTEIRHIEPGRTAYWHAPTKTVVIRNAFVPYGGTAMRSSYRFFKSAK